MVDEYIIGVRNTVTLILLGVSLTLFAVAAGIVAFKKYKRSKYSRTTGKVVDFSQRFGKSGGIVYSPIVEILVKGKRYRATSRVASSWTSYTKGDKLEVAFDPTNPQKMIFGSAFRRYFVPFIFAVQGVAWLFVTFLVYYMISSFGQPGATKKVIALAFGFIAAGFWITALVLFLVKIVQTSKYLSTTGKIIQFANRPGDVGDFLYAPIVEITVKGKKYRKTSSVASSWVSHRVGEEVSVSYDPENPNRMMFGSWIRRHILAVTFAGFGTLWAIITFFVF